MPFVNAISGFINRIRTWKNQDDDANREAVSRVFRFKYTCFKDLLASNTELLNILADLEEKLHGREVFGMAYVRSQATRAVFHTLRMVKSLDDLSGHKYSVLFETLERLNTRIKEQLGTRKELPEGKYVLTYADINKEMVDWVGGKNANLGEMFNKTGLPIPAGFAITTRAYTYLLESNDLLDEIVRLRRNLDPNDPVALQEVGEEIQRLIITAKAPEDLIEAITEAYERMVAGIGMGGRPAVAVRSSAIGEDSELSHAGQYLTVLNVPADRIVETYKLVAASLYTPRAVSYRLNKGIRDEDIAMSAAVIEMIDAVSGGVMYSHHPVHMLDDRTLINSVWGLGPYVVDGVITPDTFVVSRTDPFTIEEKITARKHVKLSANRLGGLIETEVPVERQEQPSLTDAQILELARYARKLEEHYCSPQDVEWALHPSGRLIVLQTRPLHLGRSLGGDSCSLPVIPGHPMPIAKGATAYPGVGIGPAFILGSEDDLGNFPEGGVLIAKHSDPQYVLVMKQAAAIVTDAGSVTGHMASLAREFEVPTLLDTKIATSVIEDGAEITVDAISGRVYVGRVHELEALQRPREAAMKDTPIFETLRKTADLIIPLNLVDPKAKSFRPENCRSLHDIMRFVHEYSYKEMFQISDIVSDTEGAGSLKLRAPIPLDLHIIDLGGGIAEDHRGRWVDVDDIASTPFKSLLHGMLHQDLRNTGPRPVNLGGFFSVVREQMFAPNQHAERFGDRSYAIISDSYVNFSSRIGYHYSVLDSFCSDSINKNYITFSFKGGAAEEVRRIRRVRAIAKIFQALDFSVETREDRLDARLYKYDQETIQHRLDQLGRLLQYTRQMDMLMTSERSVERLAESFLQGDYHLDNGFFAPAEEVKGEGPVA